MLGRPRSASSADCGRVAESADCLVLCFAPAADCRAYATFQFRVVVGAQVVEVVVFEVFSQDSYSLSSEHIIDNPVPRGRGDHGGLQGFLQGQNPAAIVVQSVGIPAIGGAFHDLHPGSPASSAVSRDEAF